MHNLAECRNNIGGWGGKLAWAPGPFPLAMKIERGTVTGHGVYIHTRSFNLTM